MPAFYKIDKDRRLVLTTGSGVYTLADAVSHMDKLTKDPDFDPRFSQIVDFTQVTRIELSADEIRRLAQRTIFSGSSRRALSRRMKWLLELAACSRFCVASKGSKAYAFSAALRKPWTGYSLGARRPEDKTCASRHTRWI